MLGRVIGSTDIDGNGTQHPVAAIDPFIFCDEVVMNNHDIVLPFDKHPHHGLVANTCLLQGQPSMMWDNHAAQRYGPLWPGGVFQINSGSGVCHDEGAEATAAELKQGGGGGAGVNINDAVNHVMQIWFNPGIHKGLPPAESNTVHPSDVPVLRAYDDGAADIRVLLGAYGGAVSPAKLWHAQLFVLHATIAPERSVTFDVPAHMNAWVYCLSSDLLADTFDVARDETKYAPITVAGSACRERELVEFEATTTTAAADNNDDDAADDAPAAITVNNPQRVPITVFVGAGVPHGKPWVKLLGHDGAMIAGTEAEVRAQMKRYEADPENYGKAPPGGSP
jgi:redox-sensitive bicupin YhaK (pirin superfamily)